jgi:hypothetical protein
MFAKSTIVAAFAAAMLAFMPQTALAKSSRHPGFHPGWNDCGGFRRKHCDNRHWGHDWRHHDHDRFNFNLYWGPGYGYWGPRYGYWGPGYGYYGGYYAYPNYRYGRMSCARARDILIRHGYRNIRTNECGGRYYTFWGTRGGHAYKLSVDTYSGRYSILRRA